MSYEHGTPNYNLPQTVGTDKRDWFDTNECFRNVDADLHSALENSETATADIVTVKADIVRVEGKADANTDAITGLTSDLATTNENVAVVTTGLTELGTEVRGDKQDLKDSICAIEETTATAEYRHEVGSYFWYNDTLYKTIVLITEGSTIVPDVNCSTTNITTELLNGGGGGGGAVIDDSTISPSSVWSSSKTNAQINAKTDVKIGDVRFSGGRIQTYDGHDWVNVPMSGGDSVKIDFSRVLHAVSTNNDTFTINEDGWLFFTGGGTTTIRTLSINGNVVFTCGKSGFTGVRSYAGNFHVSSGDTITATNMSEEGDSHVTVFAILES